MTRVCNYYTQCGHSVPLPDVLVPCSATNCKLSDKHPSTCVGAVCKARCFQSSTPHASRAPARLAHAAGDLALTSPRTTTSELDI
ncbi:hypothetical protein EIP91_002144 [Steccherinum ochraceum]|uniref:Uncharacterized protein n=1 Tax=Steccherinum ochraceum TaxID=92696 RepID=A0A4R0RL63_9APHY|nr:hypothetical protein EIP91_002144 [Steccherinum ochraceum]